MPHKNTDDMIHVVLQKNLHNLPSSVTIRRWIITNDLEHPTADCPQFKNHKKMSKAITFHHYFC